MEGYRTFLPHDKRGGLFSATGDKAPRWTHHAQVIRADLLPPPDPTADLGEGVPATLPKQARAKRTAEKAPERPAVPPPAPIPSWARLAGKAGEGAPLFAAGAGLALLDAVLRRDPPAAGAMRSRLALKSAVASAKILRLNADAAALRDLRFAVGEDPGPAARLLRLWRELAGRPPALDAGRLADAAARLELAPPDPDRLVADLRQIVKSADNPACAAAQAAALAFEAFAVENAPEAEVFALWVADLILALRLRWARPVPLIATKVLDPALRPPDSRPRPRPGEPAWANIAAGATALATASALDLAADLARRSETLIAVAPKLRSKPAAKIVDLMLAQDCVSPAEAARQAPMTDRAARRLFDRLVLLGAAREFSGRPTFRLYGL